MFNNITILIKELRKRTGISILQCKNALIEAHGDIELAIDIIRKTGKIDFFKKNRRITAEGVILVKVNESATYGIMIELNCETDFVTKNSDFRFFAEDIMTVAFKEKINDLNILKEKFEDKRIDLISKIGENINIRRLIVIKNGILGFYTHGVRIGVIVSAVCVNKMDILRQIAMHIAAAKPEYIDIKDIPSNIMDHEYQIQLNIAMKTNKSIEITKKIVKDRMHKFACELSLKNQQFVITPNKTVACLLKEHDIKINRFVRFEVSESI